MILSSDRARATWSPDTVSGGLNIHAQFALALGDLWRENLPMKRQREYRIADGDAAVVDVFHDERNDGVWCPPKVETLTGLCLFRSGGIYRKALGQHEFLDATVGHFVTAGVEERFLILNQPAFNYTFIKLCQSIYADQVEGADQFQGWALPVTGALDLQHRSLLTACARGDNPFEESELLSTMLEKLPPRTKRLGISDQPATRVVHRRLVTKTQEALTHGHLNDGLKDLARLVGSSPHHLSRVFRKETGRTLTSYRTQLRVQAVLEDFSAHSGTLADLAAAHGFSDHAHLTRTLRRYHGEVPSKLRAHLRRPMPKGR